MLTETQKFENKQKYLELLTRLGIDLTPLIKYLDSERVDFFNKPFNAYPENAYPGSLCEHSLKVYDELTKLCTVYYPSRYTEKDMNRIVEIIKEFMER